MFFWERSMSSSGLQLADYDDILSFPVNIRLIYFISSMVAIVPAVLYLIWNQTAVLKYLYNRYLNLLMEFILQIY